MASAVDPVRIDGAAKEADSILEEGSRLARKCIGTIRASTPSLIIDCACNTCVITS